MPTLTRVNPTVVATNFSTQGKPLTFVKIDFGASVAAKTGPDSAIETVLREVAKTATIAIVGELVSSQYLSIAVEGTFGTDTYDGTNSETFAADLEDRIQALATVDSINLASAGVTAFSSLKLG